MFDAPGPRIFALPPGTDFAAELVAGIRGRMARHPPEAMARVTLFVNTQRMRRRITEIFAADGAGFIPRLRLVTDLGRGIGEPGLPPAVPPLRRRLELTRLIDALVTAEPDLAPRAAIFDLADSLAVLMDEMHGEGVHPDAIAALDVSNHSAHWKRTQDFLGIVTRFFDGSAPPDGEARQRKVVARLIAAWQSAPPADPVIVAGSTGSRGTTALLMRAVAALPQGALVLPGFDFDMPEPAWEGLSDTFTAEDHPQFRYLRLLRALDRGPADVRPWRDTPPPNPQRNRLVSLSLRPAPVTDQWLVEGQHLGDLVAATADMTLIEAFSPRAEALAIALILREAAETGTTAALVTPDRQLARQVTAALDRWGIRPDDSAGQPLALTAPGRFLRHVAGLIGQKLTAETLLTLLKHPLTATGADRGLHLLLTRELELRLRRHGPVFPTGGDLVAWAERRNDPAALAWATALANALDGLATVGAGPLAGHVARHLRVAEALACGAGAGTGGLWLEEAGLAARAAMDELSREAPHGGILSPADYTSLFEAVIARDEVRDPVLPHPRIMIWGTREARVQGAELVVLGGLNDGVWPQLPAPDPWLNRDMRLKAGLLLPERRIGLSAHDYQQAIAARRVVLSRARRDAEAETVASRWLNRLTNLVGGLPAQGGPEALRLMRDRGDTWLDRAAALERAEPVPPAPRPAPRPPVDARPKALSVTAIRTLIRDPYAIYARHVLRLMPLDPLRPAPDPRERGQALHRVLERYVKTMAPGVDPRAHLMRCAAEVLRDEVPWPAARVLWLARLDRAADHVIAFERAHPGQPVVIEEKAALALEGLPFQLTARPDRIDIQPDGRLHIIDYKSGAPPSAAQQKHFDKQLLLEAAMAARGAFGPGVPTDVARISYVGLGADRKIEATEITPDLTDEVWQGLHRLIGRYLVRATGYAARRAVFKDTDEGDYDQLARFGEWAVTDTPQPVDVGGDDR